MTFFLVVTRIRITSRHLCESSVPFQLSIQGIKLLFKQNVINWDPRFICLSIYQTSLIRKYILEHEDTVCRCLQQDLIERRSVHCIPTHITNSECLARLASSAEFQI